MNKIIKRALVAEGTSVKITQNSNEKMVKETQLLTKSPYKVGQPRTLVFGAFATLFVAIASILIFYGCNKDKELNTPDGKRMGSIGDSIIIEDIIIPVSFSSIDFSKFTYSATDGMLVFQSLDDYAQTIDALVEICNQYSNNYITALEAKLGCSIDDANEDIVEAYITANNFFPYNPLMQFIEQIGFTNSAYPVLRAQEIEWMANDARFNAESNPFDLAGVGYVESALFNIEGKAKYQKDGDDEDEEINGLLGTNDYKEDPGGYPQGNPDNFCDEKDKVKEKDHIFYFNGRYRQVRAVLATRKINVRAKTTAYYKNGSSWLLWLTMVDANFQATKLREHCDIANYPRKTIYASANARAHAGLVEKYHTYKNSETPTYIIPYDGYPYIRADHKCKNQTVKTEIK